MGTHPGEKATILNENSVMLLLSLVEPEPSRTTFRTRNRLLCPKITGRLIESDVLPIRVVEGDSLKKLIRYLKRDEHFEKEQQVKLALHTNHRLYHN